jgi:SagB-type dehydrogenase family enzyme
MTNLADDVLLSFRSDIEVDVSGQSELHIKLPDRQFRFTSLTRGVINALAALHGTGVSQVALNERLLSAEGPTSSAVFEFYVKQFTRKGLLRSTLHLNGSAIFTRCPLASLKGLSYKTDAASSVAYRLSRFAHFRVENDEMMLESPLAAVRYIIHSRELLCLLHHLSAPQSLADLHSASEISGPHLDKALESLISDHFLCIDVNGVSAEDSETPLQQWEFHDLLFHTRSRDGRHCNRYGGSYPWLGWTMPEPVCKATTGAALSLTNVELPGNAGDVSFFEVLETRRSLRSYSSDPVTLQELGAFLFRSARVKSCTGNGDEAYSLRPYPSGGARYPLELYLIVNRCAGLEAGLYHYSPNSHNVHRWDADDQLIEKQLRDAAIYANRPATWTAQVLVLIAARFQRTQWKYESVSYSLILKEVGALIQTMYLTATAMGLAGCVLGGGNSDSFSQLTGLDYYREGSVGEFLLGRPQPSADRLGKA